MDLGAGSSGNGREARVGREESCPRDVHADHLGDDPGRGPGADRRHDRQEGKNTVCLRQRVEDRAVPGLAIEGGLLAQQCRYSTLPFLEDRGGGGGSARAGRASRGARALGRWHVRGRDGSG